MKSTLKKIWEQHKCAICAVGINLCFLAICVCFSHMRFETNDDRDISNLLANVYNGNDGQYIAFVNLFLCRALTLLYELTNNVINWYVLFSVLIAFGSLTLITHLFIRRAPRLRIGIAWSIILLALISEHHYVAFQFTKNAVCFVMVGAILLADLLMHKWGRHARIQAILAVFLLLIGSMIRFQAVFFTLPHLALYLIYELWTGCKKDGLLRWFQSKKKALLSIGLCLLLVLAARAGNQLKYQTTPYLKKYYEDNLLRADLLDYGIPDYETNLQGLADLGLYRADLKLFANQFYLDRSVYNDAVLQTLMEMKKTEQSAANTGSKAQTDALIKISEVIWKDLQKNLYWPVLIGALILFFWATKRKRLVVVIGSLGLLFAMMWHFLALHRMPDRIWYAITAPALISILYLCNSNDIAAEDTSSKMAPRVLSQCRRCHRPLSAGLLALLCIAAIVPVTIHAANDDRTLVTDTYRQIIAYAESKPDAFFLLDRPTISRLTYSSTITPLTCFSRTSHKNISIQGGWICWTPANQSVLTRWGTNNIYQSAAEGMEVYFVDAGDVEAKLAFMQRHYHPDISVKCIQKIDNVGIYRIYGDNK